MLAGQCFEEALEWAIEHDADTYSMSFSRANLGEYRSHWRKACEHASLAVSTLSQAGNYAMEGSPQFKPVPIQMPIPQDIPFAVFAASGFNVICPEHLFPVRAGRMENASLSRWASEEAGSGSL